VGLRARLILRAAHGSQSARNRQEMNQGRERSLPAFFRVPIGPGTLCTERKTISYLQGTYTPSRFVSSCTCVPTPASPGSESEYVQLQRDSRRVPILENRSMPVLFMHERRTPVDPSAATNKQGDEKWQVS